MDEIHPKCVKCGDPAKWNDDMEFPACEMHKYRVHINSDPHDLRGYEDNRQYIKIKFGIHVEYDMENGHIYLGDDIIRDEEWMTQEDKEIQLTTIRINLTGMKYSKTKEEAEKCLENMIRDLSRDRRYMKAKPYHNKVVECFKSLGELHCEFGETSIMFDMYRREREPSVYCCRCKKSMYQYDMFPHRDLKHCIDCIYYMMKKRELLFEEIRLNQEKERNIIDNKDSIIFNLDI